MLARTSKAVGTLFATAVLAGGTLVGSASAQQQDGLVNVAIGDVTILEDVRVGVAAQVAANICGVKVGPVAILATQVDVSGGMRTVCTTDQGPIRIEQN
jgi:hypothetical protein